MGVCFGDAASPSCTDCLCLTYQCFHILQQVCVHLQTFILVQLTPETGSPTFRSIARCIGVATWPINNAHDRCFVEASDLDRSPGRASCQPQMTVQQLLLC